jgi:hypothetical protein
MVELIVLFQCDTSNPARPLPCLFDRAWAAHSESQERAPASDIDTGAGNSLEVLDSERPIREGDIQLTPRHSNAFVEHHRNSYGFVAVRLMTADIPPCDVPS